MFNRSKPIAIVNQTKITGIHYISIGLLPCNCFLAPTYAGANVITDLITNIFIVELLYLS